MKIWKIIPIMLVLVLAFSLTLTGFASAEAADEKEVHFGYVAWPGVTVKTHVLKTIVEYLGYDTEMTMAMKPTVLKGLSTGDIDLFLALWLPQMNNDFLPYYEKGEIEKVRVNLEDVVWQTAVPEYVWEAGVKSHADLKDYADKFEKKWYGLEPGSSGNSIINKAIENNTYGLQDWEVMVSSEAAMLSEVDSHIKKKEWIAFSGWKPHWMNITYDLKYLDDPENIWSGEGVEKRVLTASRAGLEEDMPNFYKLLKQFKVTAPIQSKWILEYGKKDRKPAAVAKEWIANNPMVVNQWVFGVKSVDGKMARKVIANKIEEQKSK